MKRFVTPTNLWLAVIFLVYSIGIIIRSIFDANGYVTSDSAHYLQLAQNILNGDGLSTANYVSGMSTHFATWPIGYPVLIALASLGTGLGVFWASKLVNIICLALCFLIIKRFFKERAVVFALLFSISTFSNLFVYTWSEVPFLLGMLWLVFGLAGYIESQKKRYIAHLFFASLFLFLMRYIGLIGAGIIGLLGFYYLYRRQWKPMLICWVTGSLSILLSGIYLLINYWHTGQFTGMERIPRAETTDEFRHMLREGIVTELDLFTNVNGGNIAWTLVLLLLALVLFIRPKHVVALFHIPKQRFLLPGLFLFFGMVYFIAIVYMRWSAYFDTFNFRLLGPATFMLVLFLCSWIFVLDNRAWRPWRRVLLFIFGITLAVNVIYPAYTAAKSEGPTYQETRNEVRETYTAIPQESIVAFENIHARYLRMDLQFIKVHFQPYFAEAESVDAFRERTTPNTAAGTYFQVKSLQGYYHYDKSFTEIMKEGQGDVSFVPLGR